MEKRKKDLRKADYKEFYSDFKEITLSDYYNFNLQNLAQKIKMQNYKPKPKMVYL